MLISSPLMSAGEAKQLNAALQHHEEEHGWRSIAGRDMQALGRRLGQLNSRKQVSHRKFYVHVSVTVLLDLITGQPQPSCFCALVEFIL